MTKEGFSQLTAQGPLLLDGATGSSLRAAGMPVGVSPELWVLEHREVLLELQGDDKHNAALGVKPAFGAEEDTVEGV